VKKLPIKVIGKVSGLAFLYFHISGLYNFTEPNNYIVFYYSFFIIIVIVFSVSSKNFIDFNNVPLREYSS